MQKLEIRGGKKISGTIEISGSKNATLPILASTILTDKKITITNVPIVRDVETMINLLSSIGTTVKLNKKEKSGKKNIIKSVKRIFSKCIRLGRKRMWIIPVQFCGSTVADAGTRILTSIKSIVSGRRLD